MKKIGILTLYYNNYNMGGLLQAYALQKSLNDLNAEQISFDFLWHYGAGGKVKMKLKELRNLINITHKRNYGLEFSVRIQRFQEFMNLIPHSKRVYYSENEFANKYDAVIVGSDQTWAEWLPEGALNAYLLNTPKLDGKRYSYAASIGVDKISKKMSFKYKENFPKFENVSLREKSAQMKIQEILPGKDVRINIDPTLLLEEDDWAKIAVNHEKREPYIFCYFLGKDKMYRTIITELAKKLGMKIVNIPYAKDHKREGFDENFGDIQDFDGGPKEFIGWIKGASLVLTDSFHAIVFACQFRKKFYVLSRISNETSSMNRRITDFLEMFNLSSRYITVDYLKDIKRIEKVNYDTFNKSIEVKRKQSLKYLVDLLKDA